MAAKRSWPPIDLRWVNVLLCGLIGLCMVLWWSELRWAARQLPRYLQGRIGSPVERRLYSRARELVRAGQDLDTARALLERSIAIDPNSDAVYWLGEYFLAIGEVDHALEQFLRYLEFDPTRVDAYLHTARILQGQGRWNESREVLERGLDYFVSHREKIEPKPDPAVATRYNQKALGVYAYYGDSIARLEEALHRVGRGSSGS
jgi:tetratricopeptide (TPR) repeat protein